MNDNKLWCLVHGVKSGDMREKDLVAQFAEELKELNLSASEVVQLIVNPESLTIPPVDFWQ